ncbi:MAG TPA: hypothetical protein VF868_06140 [Bacteroidia bacterium]
MPQEDYIKREIDKLGQVLAKALADLLGLKSQGNSEQGIQAANDTLRSELNIDIETLFNLPWQELMLFLEEKNISTNHLELIADLMHESVTGSRAECMVKYSRVLLMYQFINDSNSCYSVNRHYKIDRLKSLIHT